MSYSALRGRTRLRRGQPQAKRRWATGAGARTRPQLPAPRPASGSRNSIAGGAAILPAGQPQADTGPCGNCQHGAAAGRSQESNHRRDQRNGHARTSGANGAHGEIRLGHNRYRNQLEAMHGPGAGPAAEKSVSQGKGQHQQRRWHREAHPRRQPARPSRAQRPKRESNLAARRSRH